MISESINKAPKNSFSVKCCNSVTLSGATSAPNGNYFKAADNQIIDNIWPVYRFQNPTDPTYLAHGSRSGTSYVRYTNAGKYPWITSLTTLGTPGTPSELI